MVESARIADSYSKADLLASSPLVSDNFSHVQDAAGSCCDSDFDLVLEEGATFCFTKLDFNRNFKQMMAIDLDILHLQLVWSPCLYLTTD